MNTPDGPEQREADHQEASEREYDELDRAEQLADESIEETLISTQTQRILTGAAMLVMLCTCFAFGGCATLQRHPVLTAVGTAIIVGSIAATAEQRQDRRSVGPCGDAYRTIHTEAPYYGDCH